ncbi:hypothetical protein J8J14_19780 [Roseomonas sp. SSH11]|uniref:Uncharacterized protein n=1 Tax=Pararoseomonas baculiformis TaxID=2820812 RepID=A0ABS4AJI5_9PROT|nr:hypothetical protein [Pararoseomonas baculiformis]MBP0447019.1 hypothetical protein [Pararoseomonas baculiformis]
MRKLLGRFRRAILQVARALRLLGPIERLHRVEQHTQGIQQHTQDIQQHTYRIEQQQLALSAMFQELQQTSAGLARTLEELRASLNAVNERLSVSEIALRDMPVRITTRMAEITASEVDRLDGYLAYHFAMVHASQDPLATRLTDASQAQARQISEKVEQEVDRLDLNLVHHVAVLRALGERVVAQRSDS